MFAQVAFSDSLGVCKNLVALKPIASVPGFISCAAAATEAFNGILKSKGCESDLRQLEADLESRTQAVWHASGCMMGVLTRTAFACAPMRVQLAAVLANGHESWQQANSHRIKKVDQAFKQCVNTLVGGQLKQYWSVLELGLQKVVELVESSDEGAKQGLQEAAVASLELPPLLAALATTAHTGLAKVLSDVQRQALDSHLQLLSETRSKLVSFARLWHDEVGSFRSHLHDGIAEEGQSCSVLTLFRFAKGALFPGEAFKSAFPADDLQPATGITAFAKLQEAVGKVAATRLEECLQKDKSGLFVAMGAALAKNKKAGGVLVWSPVKTAHAVMCL